MAIFHAEYRRQLFEADRKWKTKAVARSIVLVFSLIAFSLFASAIPIWDKYFYWTGGPNSGDWQDGFPVGVLVFTFLWNIVAMALLLKCRIAGKPWIALIVDFLCWGALIPAITWSIGLGMFMNWNKGVENYYGPVYWELLQRIGRRELAAVVFSCFVWVFELVLFIFACMDTHRWRKGRKGRSSSDGAGKSVRALDHSEFARDHDDNHLVGQGRHSTQPRFDDAMGKDIEMSPTSPTTREFV